jgi:hypothetical protein
MKYLKKILETHPEIQNVYFNESGGWVLNISNLHPISKTREEVLSTPHEEEGRGLRDEDLTKIKSLVEENAELKTLNELLAEENESLKKQLTDVQEKLKKKR